MSFGRQIDASMSVRLAVGAVLGGELAPERDTPFAGREWNVRPGWLVSASVARRWFGESDRIPFLTTTLAYGLSFAGTEEVGAPDERESLNASDLRLGVLFGMTFWDAWSPYAAGRLFAGPISWRRDGEDATGSDRHHYAVGVGSSLIIGEGFVLVADAAFLGERSISGGASFAF